MMTTTKHLLDLTADDLMTDAVVTLPEAMSLREAARLLAEASVHGAPVVDAEGRCVGVLSVSDLARWGLQQADPPAAKTRSCSFQEPLRETHGRESVLCSLAAGKCHFQTPKQLANGQTVTKCSQPHCVCLDWQMVEIESLPAEDVKHYMTGDPVTANTATPLAALARLMTNEAVHRVIVVDATRRPIGVVSSTDLVAALSHADMEEVD
jgi:CBS domain-containing protein